MVAIIAALLSSTGVHAIADCTGYGQSCSDTCQSILKRPSNSTCSDFSGSCLCVNSYSAGTNGNPPPLSQGNDYCVQQKKNCETFMCAGAVIDSFSCDAYSFSSQCMCRSDSMMRGGPMKGANETECSSLINKCRNEVCRGRKVLQNKCTIPREAVCQCEGESAKNTNGASALSGSVLASLFVGAVIALFAF